MKSAASPPTSITQHLLAYYRWDRRTHWKLDSVDRGKAGRPVLAYISYDPNLFPTYAVHGNVLWVIGLGPDKSPTLEARISIARRIKSRDGKRVGITVEGVPAKSDFFGLNDASEAVMKLVFASEEGNWSLREREGSTRWVRAHGKHLQAPRRIAPAGEETESHLISTGIQPLKDLAKTGLRNSIFLSWKHCDNNRDQRRFLRELAVALTKRGFSVWMDQLALGDARELFARNDKRKNEALRKLLAQGLLHCRAVIGVWSDQYGTPSKGGNNWTQNEWKGSRGVKRLALLPCRVYSAKRGMPKPHCRVQIPAAPRRGDAGGIADEIQRQCSWLFA